ncbi:MULTISPECIES: methylenetetrahydrofolate reductase C-terminal domain-containing protein [Thermodesulfovibrio]|jgi:ferredoxin|uniref:methylenetetrahydrofolate reductase C-terminal domain-containing protein n=1 Tax=Thermodesulfovibrio TaxID=28261 RepID=UPI00261433F4|nr:methylenetetrahydrofolate reductase C-terminal domain-containing protein [Thermodesulfovibrio sp.]
MIVTKRKQLDEIAAYIDSYKKFFLIGCYECASLCGTGDEVAIMTLKDWLHKEGKSVTGWFIAKTGCQILGTKKEISAYRELIEEAECIMVLSCGAGTQTLVEFFEGKPVIPVNDTLFIGNMRRFRDFEERCRACGECFLAITGVCVVTLCPKSMLNGPCGGYKDGKCEVNKERKCAWIIAFSILERKNLVEKFYESLLGPKDWSKANSPRTLAREK